MKGGIGGIARQADRVKLVQETQTVQSFNHVEEYDGDRGSAVCWQHRGMDGCRDLAPCRSCDTSKGMRFFGSVVVHLELIAFCGLDDAGTVALNADVVSVPIEACACGAERSLSH